LQARLGNLYFDIFPQVVLWHRDGEKAILEMTWLGQSLEQELLMPLGRGEWSPVLAVWSDAPPILEKLALLDLVIECTLNHLEAMFTVTQLDDPATAGAFVDEILAAVRVNLRQAGLLPELENDLALAESVRDRWSERLVISCCHRDLTVEHICFRRNDEGLTVRLVDPKSSVPWLDEMPEGFERSPNSLGCAAIDLAHLEISLLRWQNVMRRVNARITLASLEWVRAQVRDWIDQRRFTLAFYELCRAACFSAYAGCRCAYCLAPERRWLYDQMVFESRRSLARCVVYARSEDFVE
jgi:hypothetical protein